MPSSLVYLACQTHLGYTCSTSSLLSSNPSLTHHSRRTLTLMKSRRADRTEIVAFCHLKMMMSSGLSCAGCQNGIFGALLNSNCENKCRPDGMLVLCLCHVVQQAFIDQSDSHCPRLFLLRSIRHPRLLADLAHVLHHPFLSYDAEANTVSILFFNSFLFLFRN